MAMKRPQHRDGNNQALKNVNRATPETWAASETGESPTVVEHPCGNSALWNEAINRLHNSASSLSGGR